MPSGKVHFMDDMRFSDMKKTPASDTPKSGRDAYRQSGSGRGYSDGRDIYSDSGTAKASGRGSDASPYFEDSTTKGAATSGRGTVTSKPSAKPTATASGASAGRAQQSSPAAAKRQPDRSTAARGQSANTGRGTQGASPAHARQPQHAAPTRTPHRPAAKSGRNAPPPAHARPVPKKKRTGLKIFAAVMGLLLIFVCVVFGYGYSALSGLSYTEIEDENQYIEESTLITDSSVRNILFIGSDARDGLAGKRSDSMILFSIDKKNKQLKLTSFLRDSYVYIPSKGYKTKLNAAYSYGGEQLLIDTLEYNFKVKIDDFVMVDYTVFEDFVNLLGGLTIEDVTEAEAKYMREEVNRPSFTAGTNHVDGRTALWYCRIRYLDNDFRRTERQRKVITSIIKTAAKKNIFTLIDIVEEVLPNISTNLTKNDLISLAVGAVFKYMHYDIVQQQIPADKTWENQRINGQDVLALNLEKNQAILKEFIYSDSEKE